MGGSLLVSMSMVMFFSSISYMLNGREFFRQILPQNSCDCFSKVAVLPTIVSLVSYTGCSGRRPVVQYSSHFFNEWNCLNNFLVSMIFPTTEITELKRAIYSKTLMIEAAKICTKIDVSVVISWPSSEKRVPVILTKWTAIIKLDSENQNRR